MVAPSLTDPVQMPGTAQCTEFLQQHRLSTHYLDEARRWFMPLAQAIWRRRQQQDKPLLVALNGCQGSGKSTLAAWLCSLLQNAGLTTVTVSLDDFYLTHAQRQTLADTVHPLLATRGVPGSHDTTLMETTLQGLLGRGDPQERTVLVPSFDKSRDDRTESEHWHRIGAPVDIVIWEGWCLGASAQSAQALAVPVNDLEAHEDPQGVWRHYVNRALAMDYQPLFEQVDYWAMLSAPGFETVYRWRLEQEQKLAQQVRGQSAPGLMSAADIQRFIGFYQRLTEVCLDTLPKRVDWCFRLAETRQVQSSSQHTRSRCSGKGSNG